MTPGLFVARRLTAPAKGRAFPLRILSSSKDSVTLPAVPATIVPGRWGLFYEGDGHLALDGVPRIKGNAVTWRVVQGTPPPAGTRASWSGIISPTPGAAGLRAHDQRLLTPAGQVPTWFIGASPGEVHPTWAVHIHGLGSTRAGVLRSVSATAGQALPAVLPTYRNTAEGPRFGDGRSHLGQDETSDISSTLESLCITGHERLIIVGWSMGSQIALSLATDPRWSSRIDRIVLESPVLDWRRTLEHNMRRVGLPRAVGAEAAVWLGHRVLHRAAGLGKPLDLDAMNWVDRAPEVTQPVLVLHSTGDRFSPYSASDLFSRRAPDAVVVETKGGHTTGWNADAGLWTRSLRAFVSDGVSRGAGKAERP